MGVVAVFVDLDGTLADSMSVLFRVYCQFLKSLGKEGTREEFQSLIGPSMPEILERLKLEHGLSVDLPQLLSAYVTQLSQEYAKGIPLFPGSREFLDEWRTQLPLALVTSAPERLASSFLRQHQLEDYFTGVFTGDLVARLKPEPDIYVHALEQMGLPPEAVVAIEDSLAGVQAARGAGISSILVDHGDCPVEEGISDDIPIARGWKEVQQLLSSRV